MSICTSTAFFIHSARGRVPKIKTRLIMDKKCHTNHLPIVFYNLCTAGVPYGTFLNSIWLLSLKIPFWSWKNKCVLQNNLIVISEKWSESAFRVKLNPGLYISPVLLICRERLDPSLNFFCKTDTVLIYNTYSFLRTFARCSSHI